MQIIKCMKHAKLQAFGSENYEKFYSAPNLHAKAWPLTHCKFVGGCYAISYQTY
jgi:hypothetical protein